MLKSLPVYNKSNFTRPLQYPTGNMSVYISTRDNSESIEIITDRRAQLLKNLQLKKDNKAKENKRIREENTAEEYEPIAKRLRSSHRI